MRSPRRAIRSQNARHASPSRTESPTGVEAGEPLTRTARRSSPGTARTGRAARRHRDRAPRSCARGHRAGQRGFAARCSSTRRSTSGPKSSPRCSYTERTVPAWSATKSSKRTSTTRDSSIAPLRRASRRWSHCAPNVSACSRAIASKSTEFACAQRSVAVRLVTELSIASGSRWHTTRRASGYVSSITGTWLTWPGHFTTHVLGSKRCWRICSTRRCQAYAVRMSSAARYLRYDSTG